MAAHDALFIICCLLTALAAFAFWVILKLVRHYDARIDELRDEIQDLRHRIGCILLVVAVAPGVVRAAALGEAVADARRLSDDQRLRTRYLSLEHLDARDRALWWKVLGFHVNALSTEADLVPLRILPGGAVAAVDLGDYGWAVALWDQLAAVEPYHYLKIERTETAPDTAQWFKDPQGNWFTKDAQGNWLTEAETYAKRKQQKKIVNALAPWLDTAAAAELVNLTQAQAPIVRGDWFLWQTAAQSDRVPGYYDFLGIKNQADFFRLVGHDPKLMEASKRRELLEAVATSTVTLQPRRLGRFPSLDGFLYRTFDNRKALEDRNPLRLLNGGFKHAASEEFGSLSNGLIVWALFNDQGAPQDTAPDFIASDATAHGTDRRVHVNLSCIRCHGIHEGIQPIDGWARTLFQHPLRLQSPDYEVLKKLRAQYLRDLEGPMKMDRALYSRAVEAACGMSVPQLATAYGDTFSSYDQPVTLAAAAAEVGLTPPDFKARLTRYVRATGSVDTVLAAFLSKRGEVPREQWAEAYPAAKTTIFGTQP